jgi:cytidylate kinase
MIIAIDGFSACGKSTLAKALAKELDLPYVDTGAMYRAVTLLVLDTATDIYDQDALQDLLDHIEISFQNIDGENTTFLNGINVEKDIRASDVAAKVSEVAAIPSIREKMVAYQQQMGNAGGLVMDGRDIGTVVFPNADYKFFLTADPEIRAQRRFLELKTKGQEESIESVRANLAHRDHIDSTRKHSPLRQAEDAIVVDNSDMTKEQQLEYVLGLIKE